MKRILAIALITIVPVLGLRAWSVSGVVSCPNDNSAAGIVVSVVGGPSTNTSANGAYFLELPDQAGTYTICVATNTLPAGATVSGCTQFSVTDGVPFATVNFELSGPFCTPPPPQGGCWLTGGGTIDKVRGKPTYSFGGVVNPGCSPTAAGGGNWNVVDHSTGLHFKGLNIAVIECSGVATKSPKVNVNIIDFAGTGTISGLAGNPSATTPVCFVARGIDNKDGGANSDKLYLHVYDCTSGTTLLLISGNTNNPTDVSPVSLSTGNLQIHTTGCGK